MSIAKVMCGFGLCAPVSFTHCPAGYRQVSVNTSPQFQRMNNLCLGQYRGSNAKRNGSVFLRYDGDNLLSLILSKAFLLIDDGKIKDTTIANRIRLN